MSPAALGQVIVDRYMQFYGLNTDVTMSALDVSEMDALSLALQSFSEQLVADRELYRDEIAAARAVTEEFYYTTYIDLYDFAYSLFARLPSCPLADAASDVMDRVQNAVYWEDHGWYHDDAHGLSIYFPSEWYDFDMSYKNTAMSADLDWIGFLSAYLFLDDAYEVDDTYAQASLITNGEDQCRSINDLGADVDWLYFTITKRSDVVIETHGLSGDTRLWLYDCSGASPIEIAFDDDGGEDAWSRIEVLGLEPGTYHIKVDEYDNDDLIAEYYLFYGATISGSHGRIEIVGDADFLSTATAEGWSGNGSESDPFVIEGYDIDAHGAANCIYIADTSFYFVIQGCVLYNTSSEGAGAGEAGCGVVIDNAYGKVLNCHIYSHDNCGIYTDYADTSVIEGNLIEDCMYGIHLYDTWSAVLSGNTLVGCSIMLNFGMETFTTQIITPDNTVNGRPVYYYTGDCTDVVVPQDAGQVILGGASNIDLVGLELSEQTCGILIGYSSHVRVLDCRLQDCFIGVDLQYCDNVTVGSSAVQGALVGVYARYSENVTVTGNEVSGNFCGIHLAVCRWSEVFGNNCSANQYGIRMQSQGSCSVFDNMLWQNIGYGMWVEGNGTLAIYANAFVGNHGAGDVYSTATAQAYCDGICTAVSWSLNQKGNHWSDWTSPDSNGDGVVDTPYQMAGGATDPYPLTTMGAALLPSVVILSPSAGLAFDVTSMTIVWSGSDTGSGIVHYEIRLDGGAWVDKGVALTHTYDQLSLGSHTVEVKAIDGAGFENVALVTFVIDTTTPTVSVVSPTSLYLGTSSVTVSWTGADTPSGVSYYEVRIDGGSWVDVGTSNSRAFTGLADGVHTVEVRAWDAANHYAMDSVSFTVDTVAPTLSLDYPVAGQFNTTGSVTARWACSDALSGIDRSEVRVDGGAWTSVGAAISHALSLGEGGHTLEVRCYDEAGNLASQSVSFTVDTIAPTLTLSNPIAGGFYAGSVTAIWSCSDAGTGVNRLEVRVDGGAWFNMVAETSFSMFSLSPGVHLFEVRCDDAAGNTATASAQFTIDNTAPELDVTAPGPLLNTDEVILDWTASDDVSGISKAEVSVDDGSWAGVGPNQCTVGPLDEGLHSVRLMVTNGAGLTTMRTVSFTVDTIAPTVVSYGPTGLEVSISSPLSITFSEAVCNLTVSLNGDVVAVSVSGAVVGADLDGLLVPGTEYLVEAFGTDEAGNAVELIWTFQTKPTVEVTGQILDADGNPVAGATVTIGGQTVTTDEEGRFVAEVEPGTHTMKVSAPGMEGSEKQVVVGDETEVGTVAIKRAPDNMMVFAAGAVVAALTFIVVVLMVRRGRKAV